MSWMGKGFGNGAGCLLACLWMTTCLAQDGTYADPAAAAADPDFAIQGEYVADGRGVQVAALGDGKFHVVTFAGGLPGAGWDGTGRDEFEEDAAGVQALINDLKLKRIERSSPTLGAKPPKGAIVLFDGKNADLFKDAKLTEDGLLLAGTETVHPYADFRLHAEFRIPYKPMARGQGRGNSGFYLQSR
ncbi:MAG: hypothetical protein KDA58_03095, partial [Planctomycetaceae bacterium]|nr:hypothetical protein [Planctomycetaceae bacterium]